jgi:hypothetical protein
MHSGEGSIKFMLRFEAGPPQSAGTLREIGAWRQILHATGLIGRDAERYDGFPYGNISVRLADAAHPDAFVITGTQTSGLPVLTTSHYVLVTACHPERNEVVAEGPVRPSAESLTHGALYALNREVGCVMHAHHAGIWHHATELGLPSTSADAAYGSPEMAAGVVGLFGGDGIPGQGIFTMAGHEDGIVSFGRTAEESGTLLIACLARALALP